MHTHCCKRGREADAGYTVHAYTYGRQVDTPQLHVGYCVPNTNSAFQRPRAHNKEDNGQIHVMPIHVAIQDPQSLTLCLLDKALFLMYHKCCLCTCHVCVVRGWGWAD